METWTRSCPNRLRCQLITGYRAFGCAQYTDKWEWVRRKATVKKRVATVNYVLAIQDYSNSYQDNRDNCTAYPSIMTIERQILPKLQSPDVERPEQPSFGSPRVSEEVSTVPDGTKRVRLSDLLQRNDTDSTIDDEIGNEDPNDDDYEDKGSVQAKSAGNEASPTMSTASSTVTSASAPEPRSDFRDGPLKPLAGSSGKRTRTVLTPYQSRVLRRVLDQTLFPSTELRNSLASMLNIRPRTIQIWFQNQRQKAKMRTPNSSSVGGNSHDPGALLPPTAPENAILSDSRPVIKAPLLSPTCLSIPMAPSIGSTTTQSEQLSAQFPGGTVSTGVRWTQFHGAVRSAMPGGYLPSDAEKHHDSHNQSHPHPQQVPSLAQPQRPVLQPNIVRLAGHGHNININCSSLPQPPQMAMFQHAPGSPLDSPSTIPRNGPAFGNGLDILASIASQATSGDPSPPSSYVLMDAATYYSLQRQQHQQSQQQHSQFQLQQNHLQQIHLVTQGHAQMRPIAYSPPPPPLAFGMNHGERGTRLPPIVLSPSNAPLVNDRNQRTGGNGAVRLPPLTADAKLLLAASSRLAGPLPGGSSSQSLPSVKAALTAGSKAGELASP